MAEKDSAMAQLRRMRNLRNRVERLTAGRDALIREALTEGRTERQVAIAAGLSQARIWDIKSNGGES